MACFAFVTSSAAFSWGGALGEYSSAWMIKWVGGFGTGAILLVAGFSFIIWRFNPSFNVPNFDFLIPKKKVPEFVSEDTEEAVKQEWDLNNPAPTEANIATGNSLKENASGVSVIMPEMDETDEALGELGPKLFIDELSLNEEPGDEKKTPLVEENSRTASDENSRTASDDEAEPDEEPPVMRVGAAPLMGAPKWALLPFMENASSSVTVLPTTRAPASSSFCTVGAVCALMPDWASTSGLPPPVG